MAGEEEDDVEEEEEEEGLPVSGLNVLSGAGALWNRELGFLKAKASAATEEQLGTTTWQVAALITFN